MIFLKNVTFKKDVEFESKRDSQSGIFKIKTRTFTVQDRRKTYYDKDHNEIIPEKEVTESTFTIFKKGLSVDFTDLTIIVGDNGCGKTSFINNFIFPYEKIKGIFEVEEEYRKGVIKKWLDDDTRMLTFSGQPELIIVEKEIHKNSIIKQYTDANTKGDGFLPPQFLANAWDMSEFSNGENNLDFLQSISKIKNSLIVVDEPETSLSIKSQMKVCELIRKIISENNQIILVTHSEYMMKLSDKVYDFEKKRYVDTEKYIKNQKK